MKLNATSLAAIFLLGLIPAPCHAQDFSADVVYLGSSSHRASKLYVSKDKIRLETRGITDTVLLVNRAQDSTIALFPPRKAYQPLDAAPSEYFRVVNAEDACPDWQKAAHRQIACEKVGSEVVDGRQAVKYKSNGAADSATKAVWIDLALKFVVKWDLGDSGAELRNIKEEEQLADLFAVPPDYKILKPQKGSSKGFSPRSR